MPESANPRGRRTENANGPEVADFSPVHQPHITQDIDALLLIELDSQRASLGQIRTERRNRRRWGRYQRLTPVVALRIHSPEVRS